MQWLTAIIPATQEADQEDHGSKQPRQNSLKTLFEKVHHKKKLVEWLKV
jgi:hypothetical protein